MRTLPKGSLYGVRNLLLATAGVSLLTSVALFGLLTPRLRAQAPAGQTSGSNGDRPTFDAVSVKTNKSAGAGVQSLRMQPGGRLVATNIRLTTLIYAAYQVRYQQRVGGPDWIDNERFDIEAHAEGDPAPDQMRLMEQSLLSDRFGFQAHRETRQLPIYALVISNAGRLPRADGTKCATPSTGQAPSSPGSGAGSPLPVCGTFALSGPATKESFHATGRSVTVGALVGFFINFVDRIVVDQTNLSGTYDVDIEFTPPPLVGMQSNPNSSAPEPPPSLFTAVQELGLKLESKSGPVDVLVIDHVERPTEN
jgi:uncharacterized protein (TIGR03435 family)